LWGENVQDFQLNAILNLNASKEEGFFFSFFFNFFVIMSCPNLAIRKPHILLPDTKKCDLYKWSVVACDQFTSEPEYWKEVEKIVGDSPSTLKITYPEVYLNENEQDKAKRLRVINETMLEYKQKHIFTEHNNYVYVVRTAKGHTRNGIMVELDLEQYEFTPQAQTLIRPTEGTILERLPPRMRIRENALYELPHILILIDDKERKVIEPLHEKISSMKVLYDTDLMQDGGHITGYEVTDELAKQMEEAIKALGCPEVQKNKYGEIKAPFIFAVGDGNHSLATAKSVWEELKKKGADPATHPARYALVEINNIYDEGIIFEPIHRTLFKMPENPIKALEKFYPGNVTFEKMDIKSAIEAVNKAGNAQPHRFAYVSAEEEGLVSVKTDKTLVVETLQNFLDHFIDKKDIDFIHNTEPTIKLGKEQGHCSFLLPAMEKESLFLGVIRGGVVPRKTFSMGEAQEKRYYMECREIQVL